MNVKFGTLYIILGIFVKLVFTEFMAIFSRLYEASGSSPGVPWSLQSKLSAVPHFTSVKSEQDEKPSRMMFDAGASHGHMVNSCPFAFERDMIYTTGLILLSFCDACMS